jgi:Skp family chaperone for outer membrane proteins
VALGALVYFGIWVLPTSPLLARAPAKEKAAVRPRTRVALLNISYVVKYYDKFKSYQEEMKAAFKPFQDRDKELKTQLEELTKHAADVTLPVDRRDALAEKAKKAKQAIEDNGKEAKALIGKKTDEQMKAIYLDITEAVRRHATAHDLELVLHYNDATTREDSLSPPNIARKLQAGSLLPVYAAPGLDITKDLVEEMNRALRDKPGRHGGNPAGRG